jgi:anti-sigma-K factor RskA
MKTFGKEDEMSAQAIRYQDRKSYGSWRYAVLALVAAIALAIALMVANPGGADQTTTGGTGGSVQMNGHAGPQTTTIVVPGGPVAGHPLP